MKRVYDILAPEDNKGLLRHLLVIMPNKNIVTRLEM